MAKFNSRELVQPFTPEIFMKGGAAFSAYTEIIRSLWEQGGSPGCDLGITLNHSMFITRKVPLALGLDREMVEAHLRWEVEQSLVSPLSSYFMDYQRLPFSSQAGHPIYLLVLLRRIIVEQIQRFLNEMGITLLDVDVDLFSQIRLLLAQGGIDKSDLVAMIEVEAHQLTVVLIHEHDFYLKHVIALDEVKATKKTQSGVEITPMILKELKRLVFGHRLGSNLDALARIVITGEGGSMEFREALANQTDVPVMLLNPFSSLQMLPSVAHLAKSADLGRHYGAVVGMALKHQAIHLA